MARTNDMGHLLLYGPPGTGKTSSILALAREIFGNDHFRDRVLELNGSDDRGIAKIRTKVKQYAQCKFKKLPSPAPDFKFIILDEADNMTIDAQGALRRMMEDFSKNTRFCIICNYLNKIIAPISSRCIKLRFKELDNESQKRQLSKISSIERLDLQNSVLERVVELSKGDLRTAVNTLQLLKGAFGEERLSVKGIDLICDVL